MAIQEKITQQDLILYEILKNPVLCNEFINNIDKEGWENDFEYTWYQRELLCDFNSFVSLCQARSTGKTTSFIGLIIWLLVNNIFPSDYIVYTVPNKVHLEPVFNGLIRSFRSNSLLKHFISKGGGINSSTYTITLLNTATLLCRIAGQTGTGANVIGLHTPFVILDEASYYPWGTWIELKPILNTFTPGYRLVVGGVPNGLRENNVLYYVDMQNSDYTKHRVSIYDNPRLTKEDEENFIKDYGGKESEDFIHLALGQHGAPVYALFDRRMFELESYPVYKLVLDGPELRDNISEYHTKLSFIPALGEKTRCIFGIDLGFSEPTAIFILFEDKETRLKFHAKIQLNKVSYSIQPSIIDYLDTKFSPYTIGIDKGSSGLAIIQRLRESVDYSHKNYDKRIIPVDFSGMISLGYDLDGNELKQKTKPFAVSILQNYSYNHKIVYSTTDLEIVSELERMTYSKGPTGEISYKTLTHKGGKRGEDHFTSALLCASVAYYFENENLFDNKKHTKLFSPRWL